MPTDAMTMVRSTDQSDIRPPIVLPTIPPRPKAKSATGTNRSGCPATSVMSGATYEYIANMPPKPIDPAMNVSATCIDPKARNSCITEFASACTIRGTKTAIIASAPSATTATNQ